MNLLLVLACAASVLSIEPARPDAHDQISLVITETCTDPQAVRVQVADRAIDVRLARDTGAPRGHQHRVHVGTLAPGAYTVNENVTFVVTPAEPTLWTPWQSSVLYIPRALQLLARSHECARQVPP